uniref:hypothetical protein n=1 Tax=Limnohabitans sp. TaxID=1907725 RepID=UPI0040481511
MLNARLTQVPVLFIFGWIGILLSILSAGWTNTWKALRVPTMSPAFADMRTVQGSISSIAAEFNPQVNNPGDPWNRPMNYPSVWSWIAEIFGFQSESNYLIFVSTTVVAFFLCCYFLLRKYPSVTLLLLCFSGATLLAVERGNNDIVVFALLFLAASSRNYVSMIAIFVATALKIYPLLAFPAFLKNPRSAAGMAFLIFVAIIILFPELSAIRSATPISASLSYGSQSLSSAFQIYNIGLTSFTLTVVLISASFVFLMLKKIRVMLTVSNATEREELLFLVGSCVYIGTFILASNYDYRLIFLLLCVPFIMKLEVIPIRFGLAVLLLLALNFMPLAAMLGKLGVTLNILSKVILFITLTTITLMRIGKTLANTKLKIFN